MDNSITYVNKNGKIRTIPIMTTKKKKESKKNVAKLERFRIDYHLRRNRSYEVYAENAAHAMSMFRERTGDCKLIFEKVMQEDTYVTNTETEKPIGDISNYFDEDVEDIFEDDEDEDIHRY